MKSANFLIGGWVESQGRGKLASYYRKQREGDCAKKGWCLFRNPSFLSNLAKTKVALEMSINVMTKYQKNMPSAEFLSIPTCNFSLFRRSQTIMQNVVGATVSDMLNRSRFGIFFMGLTKIVGLCVLLYTNKEK